MFSHFQELYLMCSSQRRSLQCRSTQYGKICFTSVPCHILKCSRLLVHVLPLS